MHRAKKAVCFKSKVVKGIVNCEQINICYGKRD